MESARNLDQKCRDILRPERHRHRVVHPLLRFAARAAAWILTRRGRGGFEIVPERTEKHESDLAGQVSRC